MAEIRRESPVRFGISPKRSEVHDNWTVALAYDDEGPGPWLVDLAHKTRWDLQDRGIGDLTVGDLAVPSDPGACTFSDNTLVNRMDRTHAAFQAGMRRLPLSPISANSFAVPPHD